MRIEIAVEGPPLIPARDARKMMKREFSRRGKTWHDNYKDPHFSPVAYPRYGYAKRARKYTYAKKRKFNHTDPLVYTGTSKRLSQTKRIVATRNSVTVAMPIRVFNFRSKLSKVNKREEFTRVADFENKRLDRDQSKGLTKRIRRFRKRTDL